MLDCDGFSFDLHTRDHVKLPGIRGILPNLIDYLVKHLFEHVKHVFDHVKLRRARVVLKFRAC